jgi:hypothetical protein
MDSMIRELMGIDRIAREKVKATRQWREQQETEITAAKASLSESFTVKRELETKAFTELADKNRIEKLDALDAEYAAALSLLNAKFAANRAKWADELFNRVLEC